MNWKNKNYIGMKGGHNGTFYEVIGQSKGTHVRYPAMLDGVEIPYSYFMGNAMSVKEIEKALKNYLDLKIEQKMEAVILIVAGNSISCEMELKNQGYEASSGSSNTVDIYGYKATVDLSIIGKKGGSVKSEAKTKAARENIKKRWADKKDKKI